MVAFVSLPLVLGASFQWRAVTSEEMMSFRHLAGADDRSWSWSPMLIRQAFDMAAAFRAFLGTRRRRGCRGRCRLFSPPSLGSTYTRGY